MEQLRKDVRKNTFFSRDSRAAGLMSVVALIIALFGSSVTLVVSHRSKRTADQTAAALAASINEGRQRRAVLHRADVESCRSRHQIVNIIRVNLDGSIAAAEAQLRSGLLSQLGPQVVAAERDGIARTRKLVRDLGRADCTSVPPLPGN